MSDWSQNAHGYCNLTKRYTLLSLVAGLLFSALFLGTHFQVPIAEANFGQWKKALELLSGFWLLFAMMVTMLLALRLPWVDKRIGGLSEAYKVHRTAAIVCSVLLAVHWLVAKGPKWAIQLGLMAPGGRKPGAPADPALWEILMRYGKDMGEWVGYVLIVLLLLGFFARFLRQTSWVRLHRFFGPLVFLSAVHGICSFPKAFLGTWPQYVAGIALLCCLWLLWKQYRLDTRETTEGTVSEEKALGGRDKAVTVEVPNGPKAAIGQFLCVSFDKDEHPHPFTIIDCESVGGNTRYKLLIRDLGIYTKRAITTRLTGKRAYVQGPYGAFLSDLPTAPTPHLWVAGGVGITPFLAAMTQSCPNTTLLWCCRAPDASLVETAQRAAKTSGVTLRILDSAKGDRLGSTVTLEALTPELSRVSARYCGPKPLGQVVRTSLQKVGNTRFETENFNWR